MIFFDILFLCFKIKIFSIEILRTIRPEIQIFNGNTGSRELFHLHVLFFFFGSNQGFSTILVGKTGVKNSWEKCFETWQVLDLRRQ